ncbi:MAG: pirin family protein [Planctomycetes bacterium]|nr:pirin family protein [Planctomycetota bacterium]
MVKPLHRGERMIVLRRATERRHVRSGKQETWLTVFPLDGRPGPAVVACEGIASFSEIRLPPGGGSGSHRREEAEAVTYVYMGALAQEDSTGRSGVLQAGEFQRMTTGRRIRHKETNVSRTDWVHVFRIVLHPSEVGRDSAHEQKRYTAAQRHNLLCPVASRDGRKGSLRIHQDAVIYSSILDPGHHLSHELLPGRSAWLHVVRGEARLDDIVLAGGDGAGVTTEPSVSLTAQENAEILLVDLGPAPILFGSGTVR